MKATVTIEITYAKEHEPNPEEAERNLIRAIEYMRGLGAFSGCGNKPLQACGVHVEIEE